MKKLLKQTIIILIPLVLVACGNNHPKLTSYKAFDERHTTVIDTKNSDDLKELGAMFFNRQEATDAEGNLDFVYLIEISTNEGSSRWRCTKTGYCQERTIGAEPNRQIWFLEQYRELYQLSNLD